MLKILQIVAILSGTLASLLLLMPWSKILCSYRIKHAKKSRDDLIKACKKQLELKTKPLEVGVDVYSTSTSWGASEGALAGAKVADELNQLQLKQLWLEPFSIRNNEGFLDESLIEENFQRQVLELNRAKYYKTRNLKTWSIKLLLFAAALGIIVIIFQE